MRVPAGKVLNSNDHNNDWNLKTARPNANFCRDGSSDIEFGCAPDITQVRVMSKFILLGSLINSGGGSANEVTHYEAGKVPMIFCILLCSNPFLLSTAVLSTCLLCFVVVFISWLNFVSDKRRVWEDWVTHFEWC